MRDTDPAEGAYIVTPLRILAKSSSRPENPLPRETLSGHTLDTMNVAKCISEKFGRSILKSAGLAEDRWFRMLKESSIRGAFLHDIGKANNHFQMMIRSASPKLQALRHEIVSLWILFNSKQMTSWVFDGDEDIMRNATLFAVGGHHRKLKDLGALDPRPGSGYDTMRVLTGHPDIHELFECANSFFGRKSAPPRLDDADVNLLDDPFSAVSGWLIDARNWWENTNREFRVFVGLVKGMVISSDIAASILPREGNDPAMWAGEVLRNTVRGQDLNGIADERLAGKTVRKFQEEVADVTNRVTLVTAGCGSGKTTAAYLWGAQHVEGRKFFYCYPTTGTATQGYLDYVFDADDAVSGTKFAVLLHSRARVDIEGILENGADDDPIDASMRTDGLASWDVPVIVCTADVVLGLMQNYASALFKFPCIANGAFVFDEIHTYDDRMFAILLRFISTFVGAPTLLMTASLPPGRLRDLRETLLLTQEELKIVNDSSGLETIKRYSFAPLSTDIPWSEVESALNKGQKVIWVVNTVDRAMELAREAEDKGLSPHPYHSRYRYIDRVERHREVLDAFSQTSHASALAITTQVSEISLDLSADLLVSDLAPIPSLIQRLGRLNRRVDPSIKTEPKTAIFVDVDTPLPYESRELAQSKEWLKIAGTAAVSQRGLGEIFKEIVGETEPCSPCRSSWLDGGPFSFPAPLREGGFTVQVIMPEDYDACRDAKGRARQDCVARYAIPMPLNEVSREIADWPRVWIAFKAPPNRMQYSRRWGGRWLR